MHSQQATFMQATQRAITIAVIGGGSVGTSFIRQLANHLAAKPLAARVQRLILLEPSTNPGAGDAYQQDTPSNLLNTRVASMSPIAADPEHFHQWLHTHPALWQPQFPGVDPTPDSFVLTLPAKNVSLAE